MVIGLRPEYTYPGNLSEWAGSNTLYAANLGACLITNALIRQFDADYVDDLDCPEGLRQKYDVCILSFATHLHPHRDVSLFTRFVEKLEMKTVMLSAGIADYVSDLDPDYRFHRSVTRMLEIVSERSEWIGVRGHYSAALMHRKGFSRAVPVGCPSMYWGMNGLLRIEKEPLFDRPLIPYHLTLARTIPGFINDKMLLGQDFQDHVVFTEELSEDIRLQEWLRDQFAGTGLYERMVAIIKRQGVFFRNFQRWFDFIGQHDFVIGPRLHGCIAGLVQGIPTVMTPRDLRGREIAEFFNLPVATYDDLKDKSLREIYENANFDAFNKVFPERFRNFQKVVEANGMSHNFAPAVVADNSGPALSRNDYSAV